MSDEKKLRAQVKLLRKQLQEAEGLLVRHHESSACTFRGLCPICTDNGLKVYPHDIFGRIEKVLDATVEKTEGEEMTQDEQEHHYSRGSRAAWLRMLQECLWQLGYDDPESQKAAWILEREATVAALRRICDEQGDNNWPNELHLADVVEKHLRVRRARK